MPFACAARTSCSRSPIISSRAPSSASRASRCATSRALSSSAPAEVGAVDRRPAGARGRTARRSARRRAAAWTCRGTAGARGRQRVRAARRCRRRRRSRPAEVGEALAVEGDRVLDRARRRWWRAAARTTRAAAGRRSGAAPLRRGRSRPVPVERVADRARDAGEVVGQRAVEVERAAWTAASRCGARGCAVALRTRASALGASTVAPAGSAPLQAHPVARSSRPRRRPPSAGNRSCASTGCEHPGVLATASRLIGATTALPSVVVDVEVPPARCA